MQYRRQSVAVTEYFAVAARYTSNMRSLTRLLVLLASLLTALSSAAAAAKFGELTTALNTTGLKPGEEAVVAIVFDLKPKFHAQSHTPSEDSYIKYEVKLDDNAAFTAGTPRYPAGEEKSFAAIGKLNVYEGKIVVYIPVTVKADAKPTDVKITGAVRFQACDDTQCFAPEKPKFELMTKVVGVGEAVKANEPELFKAYARPTASQPTTAPDEKKGAAAAGKGETGWGDWFRKPWFVWPVTVILVVMSLGMFGLFTFRLPLGVYTIEPKHDTYLGNFLFGILTAVLSTPCTAPIFPGLLAWAVLQAKSGGRFAGVGVITMVGVGMALPYLFLSGFPELARKMPRTGPWSELVKQMMGFLVLAVAGYFAGQQILPGNEFMWVVFVIAVAAAIFLVFRTAKLMPRTRPIAIAAILAVCICGSSFALAHTLTQKSPVAWVPYSDDGLAKTKASGKLALIDFTAKWCANCQLNEARVFTNPKVLARLGDLQVGMFRADLTKDGAPGADLVTQLNPAGGIPITAIYSPKREKPYVLTSIYSPNDLMLALDAAEKGAEYGTEKDMSYLVAFAFALFVGVIFNVMPCVLPVLPLKAIGFYEVSQHNRAKALSYGLVFSLGIIATFAVLALLVLPVAGPTAMAVK